MEKYIELRKEKYPKVETWITKTENIFHYIDKIQIGNLEVFIDFACNKNGNPIGYITNSYFEQKDIPTKERFWLQKYKKELINRIREDLLTKKKEINISR